jgi:hypothetical protein
MLEYVFFNEPFTVRFIERLEGLGLPWERVVDPIEGDTVIRIEEPEDALWDEVDDYYDELSDADQLALENSTDDSMSTAGIYIELSSGRKTLAKVKPATINRMLSAISMDELNEFIEVIVKSVEEPDDSPICQQRELP